MTSWRPGQTDERQLQLVRRPASAGEARRFVARMLGRRRVSPEAHESAMLVSSELVTNALRHGQGQIEIRIKMLEDRLRIEVVDEGEGEAPAVRREANHAGGWGLRIVDQLALGWGVEGTTHVWADLALA